jgi:hypothetical protein
MTGGSFLRDKISLQNQPSLDHGMTLLWANCFITGRSACGVPSAVQIAAAIASAVRM